MGCSPFSKRCSVYSSDTSEPYPPNPDPARFQILRLEEFGRNTVAEIKYLDCTNFEGRKVLVYLGVSTWKIRGAERLDPHFSEDRNTISPTARFEPTSSGWEDACNYARAMK